MESREMFKNFGREDGQASVWVVGIVMAIAYLVLIAVLSRVQDMQQANAHAQQEVERAHLKGQVEAAKLVAEQAIAIAESALEDLRKCEGKDDTKKRSVYLVSDTANHPEGRDRTHPGRTAGGVH